ncbi:DUF1816 domain-containing protein [Chamaesiphon polymorphus]|uniref:DUF1816 domain-containing protein n=1 Tax=Chamaesiphon polymorphus CCALA 037 TaxID=2107692 RepID=A0A2T1GMJ5_9CYAN|nr:DUF1816 domain-containing protein [Chamaesiphon polymorphus]PSB59114.1 hypothetical protein C7B77_02150 [Chamaesiphon polymorphus CCALA 037]
MDSDNQTSPISNTLNYCTPAWWIEIFTAQPKCTYYFGPFDRIWEAETAISGYLEDLHSELAQGIQTKIDKCCQPDLLTIEHDRIDNLKFKMVGH